jgi:transposase
VWRLHGGQQRRHDAAVVDESGERDALVAGVPDGLRDRRLVEDERGLLVAPGEEGVDERPRLLWTGLLALLARRRGDRALDSIQPADQRERVLGPSRVRAERGIAGPRLLAKTIVYRWQDHLPLYRQSSIHARDGLEFARSTICGWHEQLADLAEVVVDAMLRDAFTQPYLCADATGVLV